MHVMASGIEIQNLWNKLYKPLLLTVRYHYCLNTLISLLNFVGNVLFHSRPIWRLHFRDLRTDYIIYGIQIICNFQKSSIVGSVCSSLSM